MSDMVGSHAIMERLRKAESDLAAAQQAIAERDVIIERMYRVEFDNVDLRKQLAERDKTIAELREQARQGCDATLEMERECKSLRERIASLEAQLAERRERIEKLPTHGVRFTDRTTRKFVSLDAVLAVLAEEEKACAIRED